MLEVQDGNGRVGIGLQRTARTYGPLGAGTGEAVVKTVMVRRVTSEERAAESEVLILAKVACRSRTMTQMESGG